VIFDRIVRASWEIFRDLRPAVTKALVGLKDGSVFKVRPRRFGDVRVQMVVPVAKQV
jgi:hypothetical protein